jgi:NADH-quinone oxidoreductase subunit F
MVKVLNRMERGGGRLEDIDIMKDVGDNMLFKSFCALGDGAVSPIDSSIKYFRDEYEEHVRLGGCPFGRAPAGSPEPREVGAEPTISLREALR